MALIIDESVKDLNKQRHQLMLQYDKKEISEMEYMEKLESLNKIIREKMKALVGKEPTTIKTNIERNENMADEVVENKKRGPKPKEAKVAKAPKEKKRTVSSALFEALQMKTLNTREKVLERVSTEFKDADKKKVNMQLSVLLTAIKKQKRKVFAGYVWDAENFLLTKKQ